MTWISTSISLNLLWSKTVVLKSSDQDYVCCTEDAETGSPAQSVVVRGNYSQLVAYTTSHVECYFLRRGEWREREKKKPAGKRRDGSSSDEHPPLSAGTAAIPLSLRGCPGWPRDLPQALSHSLFLWIVLSALIRACRECSVLTLPCSPSWVSSGQSDTTAEAGRLEWEGSVSASAGHSPGEPPPPQYCVCWGEAVGMTAWEQPCGASTGKGLRLWDSLGEEAPSWEGRQGPEGPTEDPKH